MVETFVILEARLRVRYNGCSSPQSSRVSSLMSLDPCLF